MLRDTKHLLVLVGASVVWTLTIYGLTKLYLKGWLGHVVYLLCTSASQVRIRCRFYTHTTYCTHPLAWGV